MLKPTLSHLKCPNHCKGELCLTIIQEVKLKNELSEVRQGTIHCPGCKSDYPILAGVALLVRDVEAYLMTHTKGIVREVKDSEIPKKYLRDFLEVKAEVLGTEGTEHIEEDLEAERVISLYLANHYLHTKGSADWWKPKQGAPDPLMDQLITQYWDQGPFSKISEWAQDQKLNILELGCGVGGLFHALKSSCSFYLGVDSSFGSIVLARHLLLGTSYAGKIKIPGDLLQGQLYRDVSLGATEDFSGRADFVLGELEAPPVIRKSWDWVVVLNAMDMMVEPWALPEIQADFLKPTGRAIQSCPYIWHALTSEELRNRIPRKIKSSSNAVEWLYEQAGFEILEKIEHLPWLFFKHVRQLELYSVHLMMAGFKK